MAALIAWKLTVINAISNAAKPETTNTHHSILIRYAKSCSHVFITYHATGTAMIAEIKTSFKKSVDSIAVISDTLAPSTFLMPISFTFCRTVNVVNPNNPKQAMIKERIEKYKKNFENLFSAIYWSLSFLSIKLYSSNAPGKFFLQLSAIQLTAFCGSF